jgi:hypothetical protein
MSKKHLTPSGFLTSTSNPSFPTLKTGDTYFNTVTNTLYCYTGSTWVSMGGTTATSSLPDIFMLGGM